MTVDIQNNKEHLEPFSGKMTCKQPNWPHIVWALVRQISLRIALLSNKTNCNSDAGSSPYRFMPCSALVDKKARGAFLRPVKQNCYDREDNEAK